jgi:hypothetical protein
MLELRMLTLLVAAALLIAEAYAVDCRDGSTDSSGWKRETLADYDGHLTVFTTPCASRGGVSELNRMQDFAREHAEEAFQHQERLLRLQMANQSVLAAMQRQLDLAIAENRIQWDLAIESAKYKYADARRAYEAELVSYEEVRGPAVRLVSKLLPEAQQRATSLAALSKVLADTSGQPMDTARRRTEVNDALRQDYIRARTRTVLLNEIRTIGPAPPPDFIEIAREAYAEKFDPNALGYFRTARALRNYTSTMGFVVLAEVASLPTSATIQDVVDARNRAVSNGMAALREGHAYQPTLVRPGDAPNHEVVAVIELLDEPHSKFTVYTDRSIEVQGYLGSEVITVDALGTPTAFSLISAIIQTARVEGNASVSKP